MKTSDFLEQRIGPGNVSRVAPASTSTRVISTRPTRGNKTAATSEASSGQANVARPQQAQLASTVLHLPEQASAGRAPMDSRPPRKEVSNALSLPVSFEPLKPNFSNEFYVNSTGPDPQVGHGLSQHTSLLKPSTPMMSPSLPSVSILASPAQAPSTPSNQQTQSGVTLRTPASADKKHIARDILRSLGSSRMLNGKRKRSDELPAALANKRGQKMQLEGGSTPDTQLGILSALQSDQHFHAIDAVSAIAALPAMEEDEDDEAEINLVEDMTSLPPPPPFEAAPKHIDNSGDTQDAMTMDPIAMFQFPPPLKLEEERSKAKEPLFLPSSKSSSPNGRQTPSVQYGDGPVVNNVDIIMDWGTDMTAMKDLDASAETLPALKPMKRSHRRMEVFVLVPPPPDWVKRAKLRRTRTAEDADNRMELLNDKTAKSDLMKDAGAHYSPCRGLPDLNELYT